MKAITYRRSWSSSKTEEEEVAELFGTILVSADESEAYETNESALFLGNNGKYSWIDANGCSCWDGDWDGWELTKLQLLKMAKGVIERKYGRTAEVVVAEWILKNIKA